MQCYESEGRAFETTRRKDAELKLIELASEIDVEAVARANSPSGPRTAGTHVSSLIRHLENTVMKPGQRKPYEELSREERRRMGNYTSMGWAFEDIVRRSLRNALAGMYGDVYMNPGEIEQDGIIGTPDDLNLEFMAVEELKATWRSSRRNLETDFWSWMVQMKAYCFMLRLREARLRTFFVNGNYRESGPQFKQWHIEFTDKELEDNWKMLTNAKKEIESDAKPEAKSL